MGARSFTRLNLGTKFTLATCLFVVITSLTIATYVIFDEMKDNYGELEKHGRYVAAIVAQNSEYGIYTEDTATLSHLLGSLMDDPTITYAAVFNARGRRLVQHNKDVSFTRAGFVEAGVLARTGNIVSGEFVHEESRQKYISVIAPVLSQSSGVEDVSGLESVGGLEEEYLGHVLLVVNQKALRERVREFVSSVLLFTCLFILASIIVTVLMSRRIVRPVNRLRQATRSISEGNLESAVPVETTDEIADLASDFNHMLERLKSSRQEVEAHMTELAATRSRLQHLLVSTPAIIYSAEPSGDFPATFVSENIRTLLGYEPEEFLEEPNFWKEHIHGDDVARVLSLGDHLFTHDENAIEYRFCHKDGYYVWMYDEMRLLRDEEGTPQEIIGYLIDITERKILEEQLQHDALHDSLTGLSNRNLLNNRLELCLARVKRKNDHRFAVLFMDLDRFKNVNDSYGHSAGDELLVAIARKLETCVRPGDTVARLGGDEFAILLDDIRDMTDAQAIAERVQDELSQPFTIKGMEIFIGVSIGITPGDGNYSGPEEIVRDADIAMYQAKARGTTGHIFFDRSMHVETVRRLQLEHDLRRAVERKEFLLHYQPIVSLEDSRITGFEALVRWKHPERGLIYPLDFIPLAEETGLIHDIGRWCLREACGQMRSWQEQYQTDRPLSISINISVRQFEQSLIEDIRALLEETGLDPRSLILEITESIIMEKSEQASALLEQLRDLNIRLHVDDFGTGYSSLAYLHHFPIDTLKIDRTFVSRLTSGDEKDEIVRAIISLAQSLEKGVIAEGVETSGQLNALKTLRCTQAQGFLFSKPVTSEKAEALLERRHVDVNVAREE